MDQKFTNLIEYIYPKFWDEIEVMRTLYFSMNIPSSFRYKNLGYLATEKYLSYGILQDITLNLPRYAYITKDEDQFLELLTSKLFLCSNILLKKYDIIKKRMNSNHLPLCSIFIEGEALFKLENQGLSVSLVGLNEAIKYLTSYDLHENVEMIKLCEKILTEINRICLELSDKHKKNFILSESLSGKASNRFSQLDSKYFPKEVSIASNNKSYTNSIHFREDVDIDLLKRVKMQQGFHKFIHEGAFTNISLKDLKRSKINIKDFLLDILKDSKISNLKFYV